MAKAVATCKCSVCGNEFDVVAFKRNCSEADSFVRWAEANITVCRECEIAETHAAALEESKDMPDLTGSEKQIKWAIDIRAAKTRETKDKHFGSKHAELCWKSVVAAKTEARFWIDNRDYSAEFILAYLLEKEPETFAEATEAVDRIEADAYAELDRIAASAMTHGKQDRAEQTNEVRAFLKDVFADPSIAPAQIIAKFAVFSGHLTTCGGLSISDLVRATLRDGKVYDSASKQWIDRLERPVAPIEITEQLTNNDLTEFKEEGVILHIFTNEDGLLLPNIQHADCAEDFTEYLSYADLGLPTDCTTEDVYDAMDPRFQPAFAAAVERLAGRVNALRTYRRNRKD